MNEAQLTKTITFKGTSEGIDKLTADLNKLASATENVAVVTEKSAGRIRSIEDAYKRQTLRLDEAARAQDQIARATKLADAALRENVISQQQHAQRIELIQQHYGTATQATQKFGQQSGLARHELINLGRQAQDVAVSLAGGQGIGTVLMQQGSQIADVFLASGKSVGDFFKQATSWAAAFARTPAGIVTGVLAIGAAAAYAAYQFTRSSTTVEQALAEQTRLLKENKTAMDDLVAARIKLQTRDLTQFQTERSELDLRTKLKQAAQEMAETGRRVVSFEEGFPAAGPSAANANAGYASIKAAVDALNASIASGKPAVTEYINELGKIGKAHPELARTLEWMIRQNEEAPKLAEAWQRMFAAMNSPALRELNNRMAAESAEASVRQAEAVLKMAQAYPGMSIEVAKILERLKDQLNVASAITGIAEINAQHQATINQLLLEGKSLTEATAIADAQRAVALARVNAEAQRTLKQLQQENELINAAPGLMQDMVRARQTYNNLIDQGVDKTLAEAVANQQLKNAIDQRAQAHKTAMISLEGQLSVAQAISGVEQIEAQYLANINNLLRQGFTLAQATAQAEMQRAAAYAQVEANAERRLIQLQREYDVIVATSEAAKEAARARNTYNELIDQGVSSGLARRVADQQQANESSARRQREYAEEIAQSEREAADEAQRAAQAAQDLAQANAAAAQEAARLAANYERAWEALKFIPFGLQDVMAASRGMDITAGLYQSKQGGYSQFNPAGYQQQLDPLNLIYSLTNKYGAGGFDPQTGAPNAQGLAYAYGGQFSAGTPSASGLLGIGLTSTRYIDKMPQRYFDPQRASLIQRGIELMPKEQQLSAYQQLLEMAKGAPGGIEQAELVKQLMDKLEQLTRATDANTSATQAMTDVLSPFYSSDPRRTHLGFRAFAGGGIMSSIGELPMMSASTHRGGGITNTPQAAMFGEGSVPEAYVPVPSGRIPVVISGAANSNQRPINVRITVMGNADSATVAGLKQTAFQRVQALRRMGG